MSTGKVTLLGGGCGDLAYLTLAGKKALEQADAVVYDALVNPGLLAHAPNAERIFVGKRGWHHPVEQDEINTILIQLAKEGNQVVRLKGGDPFVFGRGGEECEALIGEDVPFEVIPGITSALGGLLSAGIPVTHRDEDHAFAVITGQPKDESKEIDWKNLATFKGALIFLMGMRNIRHITTSLIRAGKDPNTPAAVIHAASMPEQKTVFGTLGSIAEQAEGIKAPSLIVIGGVVRHAVPFREEQENATLLGKRILVTREKGKNEILSERLTGKGAEVLECPSIETVPLPEGIHELRESFKRISTYTDLVFTSATGVSLFFEELFKEGMDARKLSGLQISVIGPGTEKALQDYGICADIVAESNNAEGLFQELEPLLSKNSRVLLPRAEGARAFLRERIEEICSVDEIRVYESVPDMTGFSDYEALIREERIDAVTLMSASSAKAFLTAVKETGLQEAVENLELITIGPETSKAVREEGFQVGREACLYTLDGLCQAVEERLTDAAD